MLNLLAQLKRQFNPARADTLHSYKIGVVISDCLQLITILPVAMTQTAEEAGALRREVGQRSSAPQGRDAAQRMAQHRR